VINTEDIEDPFAETEASEKIIVGGRSLMLFSDKTV
jgi:hypothetical protein